MTKSCSFIYVWLIIARFTFTVPYLSYLGLLQVFLAMSRKSDENDISMSPHFRMAYCKIFLHRTVFTPSWRIASFYLQCAINVMRVSKLSQCMLVWLQTKISCNVPYLSFHELCSFILQCGVKIMRMTNVSYFIFLWLIARFSCSVPYLALHGLLQVFLD